MLVVMQADNVMISIYHGCYDVVISLLGERVECCVTI
jgi:hypothetical protein